jgi:mannose-6-phosphate isomerase-like protein (cupin superfamily)
MRKENAKGEREGLMMDRFPDEILRDTALDEIEARTHRMSNPVDHWTPAVLLERAAYLRKLARHGDGCASETLKEFPQHTAMLSFRSRSGEAEVHEKFADLFVVLAGSATLLTGGVVTGARSIAPGETRGAGIEGAATQTLRAGDLAHVPAATPHQFLLNSEQTITCLVMKVQEIA